MFTRILLFLLILVPIVVLLPRLVTEVFARARLVEVDQAFPAPVAIVFGAGLRRDGGLTPVLSDRVATGVDLYFEGKVQKLLMSGDNRTLYYNEPGAMRDYAVSKGVPEEDIVVDYAGRRTYDTCYRAREIFGVEQALLVTQGFHLPRALYTCNALDLSATGVSADRRPYTQRSLMFWHFREMVATLVAFWDLHVSHPSPVLGDPEPIFGQVLTESEYETR
jgi:vancomycin permeability regulator SanA